MFKSLSVSILISPFRLIAFSDVSYGFIILAFSQVVNREIKNFSKKFCEGGEKASEYHMYKVKMS